MIHIGSQDITPAIQGADSLYIGETFVSPIKNEKPEEEKTDEKEEESDKENS